MKKQRHSEFSGLSPLRRGRAGIGAEQSGARVRSLNHYIVHKMCTKVVYWLLSIFIYSFARDSSLSFLEIFCQKFRDRNISYEVKENWV